MGHKSHDCRNDLSLNLEECGSFNTHVSNSLIQSSKIRTIMGRKQRDVRANLVLPKRQRKSMFFSLMDLKAVWAFHLQEAQ